MTEAQLFTEQQVLMTAELYKARDGARTLLGAKYHGRMAELGHILARLAVARRCSLLSAAIDAARSMPGPFDQIQLLAAAVEAIEPTPQEAAA